MRSRTRRVVAVATAVVMLIGACNDDDGPMSAKAGTVASASPLTEQNGAEVFGGEDLLEEADLTTDSSGESDFEVVVGPTNCSMGPSSGVEILPGDSNVALTVKIAPTSHPLTCAVKSKTDVSYNVGDDVVVSTSDPVFSMSLERDTVVVKSYFGFLAVTSVSTQQSVVVGPGQQTVVGSGLPPGPVAAVEPTEFEQEKLPRLFEFVEPVDVPAVDVDASTVLSRVFETSVFLIAVDEAALAQSEIGEFLFTLESFLASRLEVDVAFEVVDRAGAIELVAEGSFHGVLTPEPYPETDRAPLFVDARGLVWEVNVLGDPAFGDVFPEVLAAVAADGEYGNLIREFFGRSPDYDALFG